MPHEEMSHFGNGGSSDLLMTSAQSRERNEFLSIVWARLSGRQMVQSERGWLRSGAELRIGMTAGRLEN
jgi:hypothetical protein